MKLSFRHRRRGFTLTELTVVMGVIGILLSGVWVYAASARQTQNLTLTIQSIALVADAARAAYGGAASISGAVSTVMPNLVQAGAIPNTLLRTAASTCNGVKYNYADHPLKNAMTDACGTFRVCAWDSAASIACGAPAAPTSMQYFAIELTSITYGSCLQLAEGVSPAQPGGLIDVWINGKSVVASGTGLPVAPATATAKCTPGSTANVIDFVYSLRSPLSS